VPETFLVFSGDDSVTLPVIALGGVGVVSVCSNEIPHEMAALTRAALANDWATARTLQRKYLPLMQANFIESSPLPVKAVLAMMGKIEEVYRLPLLPMRRDTRSRLQKIVAEVGVDRQAGRSRPRDTGIFHLRELGRRPTQNRAAPRIVRPMQPRQRPSRRPRH
jgi:4-hydroxy-tetrahydrodipicolinate synthase